MILKKVCPGKQMWQTIYFSPNWRPRTFFLINTHTMSRISKKPSYSHRALKCWFYNRTIRFDPNRSKSISGAPFGTNFELFHFVVPFGNFEKQKNSIDCTGLVLAYLFVLTWRYKGYASLNQMNKIWLLECFVWFGCSVYRIMFLADVDCNWR